MGAKFFPPVEKGPGYRVSFPGVKRPKHGVDHLPRLVPRIKKEWSYTSTSLCTSMAGYRLKFTFTFYHIDSLMKTNKRNKVTKVHLPFERHQGIQQSGDVPPLFLKLAAG